MYFESSHFRIFENQMERFEIRWKMEFRIILKNEAINFEYFFVAKCSFIEYKCIFFKKEKEGDMSDEKIKYYKKVPSKL